MQGVPVARPVAEDERGGPGLPGPVAHVEPLVEGLRPGRRTPELRVPVPGDREQPRIKGVAELVDRCGEGARGSGTRPRRSGVDP